MLIDGYESSEYLKRAFGRLIFFVDAYGDVECTRNLVSLAKLQGLLDKEDLAAVTSMLGRPFDQDMDEEELEEANLLATIYLYLGMSVTFLALDNKMAVLKDLVSIFVVANMFDQEVLQVFLEKGFGEEKPLLN